MGTPSEKKSQFKSPSNISGTYPKLVRPTEGKRNFSKSHRHSKTDRAPETINIRELLHKSKEPLFKLGKLPESLDHLANVKDATETANLNNKDNQPVLLREKSIWKKKVLEEDSLVHLLTLETLYAHNFLPCQEDKVMNEFLEETLLWFKRNSLFSLKQNITAELSRRVKSLVKSITKNKEKIIIEITPFLIDWSWDRLPHIRQLILITAWYFIKNDSPRKISFHLNNAINHAKWFGEDKDYAFVNSILDKLITHYNLWPLKKDRERSTIPKTNI